MRVRNIVLVALFTALMVVGAYVAIPIPFSPVPLTLQIFFTLLAGALLGPWLGALSQLLYVLLGLVGLPVFAGGAGGFGSVLTPSFGYLIGMIVGAFVSGIIVHRADKLTFPRMLVASLVGLLAIYAVGVPYMYFVVNFYVQKKMAVRAALLSGFLVFLPLDIVKCVVATELARRLRPLLRRSGK